jgi:Rps23 Pro-64 3,4-dihydroxylase Tpa1-like proline 4-hydroxylase
MIKFSLLENRLKDYEKQWTTAKPFSHLVIDDILDPGDALRIQNEFPDPVNENMAQSRDYIFARNKYEKSKFWEFGPACNALHEDLMSPQFAKMLGAICGRTVWIDPDFHGGGMHQGGRNSFLDMHTDFNLHPLHEDWFRDLNILIYLNPNWTKEWGGELRLQHRKTGEAIEVEPKFGRCVIMETRDYTLHGYDPIRFPEEEYRRSIACYAYSALSGTVHARSTAWYPSGRNVAKRLIGRGWPYLVIWKNRIFGSATAKNR